MIKKGKRFIVVVNDVAETLAGIEILLASDGYRVEAAKDEVEAVNQTRFQSPDLILLSLEGELKDVIAAASRIRKKISLDENLQVIIFCVGELSEGTQAKVGNSIYLAHPDNFNQLREFIKHLLLKYSTVA